MKKLTGFSLISILFLAVGCSAGSSSYTYYSAGKKGEKLDDYRKPMRDFVIGIAEYAREFNPDFIVIPQNGQCVAWDGDYDENSSDPENVLAQEYFAAINGTGREDTFYGAGDEDYTLSPEKDSLLFQAWCDVFKAQTGADGEKITVISADYCKEENKADSDSKNFAKGYISYAAPERDLSVISNAPIYNENSLDINRLSDAKNLLYLLNYEKFSSRIDLLESIRNTNYDLIIMDGFSKEGDIFTAEEINSLKQKKNGGKRLVVSYMSIGEAESYRWYFKSSWVSGGKPSLQAPSWLDKENPYWEGNYKVRYWNPGWQKIIYGNNDSYTKLLLDAGFDGVYLDIIDAYEYYEE